MTRNGPRPVRWLGFRSIDLARHAAPELVTPIRFRKDSVAPGQPCRDLLLSPDHAIYLDGSLVLARMLVNGGSITRETGAREVVYYHVELDAHDILIANGLPAESYLDTDNRSMFENGGEIVRLHADFGEGQAAREAGSCAPLLIAPADVEPHWRAAASRAAEIGCPLPDAATVTDAPDLHILIGGQRIDPISAEGGRYRFELPDCKTPPRLVSRAARPSDEHPWISDGRLLGVKVRRMTLRCGQKAQNVALDDQLLHAGWWAAEVDDGAPSRWTDGDAALPFLGEGVLELELAGTMRYPATAGLPLQDKWAA